MMVLPYLKIPRFNKFRPGVLLLTPILSGTSLGVTHGLHSIVIFPSKVLDAFLGEFF